jgi:hypothetical protein
MLDKFVRDLRGIITSLKQPHRTKERDASISGGVMQRDLKQVALPKWTALEKTW